MSACWLDSENSGKQDIYVSNMWSAAGQRIAEQPPFHPNDPANIKTLYRQHARGNSFYKNLGNGHFENSATSAGLEMGRWAWSSDSWDFDHDGFADIYVTNGYISGSAPQELSSFFWRQVVGNSPLAATPSAAYEHGWNAINELIRSDHTWSGYERNVTYANNGDGTFSDVSGISGLDFLDDSRAFALADLNHDGRLEVILKNRTGPQLRILQNTIPDLGDSVSFRLRGTKSNRDAIGASMVVAAGKFRQTKYLQAGTGFLSQHSKEIFFGLGKSSDALNVTVRWPNGTTQTFQNIPRNHHIELEEGSPTIAAKPFTRYTKPVTNPPSFPEQKLLPDSVATWLLEPLPSLDFTLDDSSNNSVALFSLRGKPVLLCFCSTQEPAAIDQLRSLNQFTTKLRNQGAQILAVNLDTNTTAQQLQALSTLERFSFPLLQGTADVAGVYNIIYRYLFDRRRDLPLPTSFLLDESGDMVKIYQGNVDPAQILADVQSIPHSYEARVAKSLPFPGNLYNGRFRRNDFTYGIALFQHGYLDQSAASFKQVISAKPDNAEAHYNLGTLYLRKNDATEARKYLEQAVRLQPDYPDAWNNLGMIAAQQNRPDEAQRNFRRSLAQRPDYVTALLNLGNLLRRQGDLDESAKLLSRAVDLEPQNAEANYNLGMLYARQNDFPRAESFLQKAATLRPNYADAMNNLGVLFVRDGKSEAAEQQFRACISAAPNFDQAYLNLARVYALATQNDKARAVLESLLKLQPDHKLARQALEMLH
jgi:Flp pilus assembly protein TadD/peroxiredoxin